MHPRHARRKVVVHLLPNEQMDELMAAAFGPFSADMDEEPVARARKIMSLHQHGDVAAVRSC
jgi:hypothetical protein